MCLEDQQNERDVPIVFRHPGPDQRLELTCEAKGRRCVTLLESWKHLEMIKTEKRVESCRKAVPATPATQTKQQPEFRARSFAISLVRTFGR